MQERRPIIELKDVSVTYNAGTPISFQAIKDVSLSIYENEYVVFFGPSGSGKSTLLYVIAGLEQPTQGKVMVKNSKAIHDMTEEELIDYHRYYVGMIFQAFYLVPTLTAEHNVALPLTFSGFELDERQAVIRPLLDRFGIAAFRDRLPQQLSGGQQQRVAIARSLVHNPPIILADEPVGNLDSENADKVLDLLHELRVRDKKTVIHVTHDPRHLRQADRVFYIEDGMIVKVVENMSPRGSESMGTVASQEVSPELSTAKLLGDLSLQNPYAQESSVAAKLIAHQLISPYSYYELLSIEKTIQSYLENRISRSDMQQFFDRSVADGGLGLYRQRAAHLADMIDRYAHELSFLRDPSHASRIVQAQELVRYIVEERKFSVPQDRRLRLAELIAYRLAGGITPKEFRAILDESYKEGGVGLHAKTAAHIADQVELLIAGTNPETYAHS